MVFIKCLKKIGFFATLCAIGCAAQSQKNIKLEVQNTLPFERNELVGVTSNQIKSFLTYYKEEDIRIINQQTKEYLTIQWIDNNGDGKNDELLFPVKINANSKKTFLITSNPKVKIPESKAVAYSRFVPERVDDYTWENDKIAFRMYGPKGQAEALQGIKSSTISSGVDIWLKKTERSIINDWYKGYLKDKLYYHQDRGEGYDPYHVGKSRGTGGLGIWTKDSLQVSQNFAAYKTIATGPLRTIFELKYEPWSEFGVRETKKISLDIGSNFTKFESSFEVEKPTPNYTAGITLHKNEGETKLNPEKGWFLHWEKIDDAYVGEGIVVNPKIVEKAFARKSKTDDQSNLLVVTKPKKNLVYYAGFAWQKSGQVQTQKDWENILKKQSEIIANPLIMKIIK